MATARQAPPNPLDLTRRERQIMNVVHRDGRATAADIKAAIADAPSYSGVRTILRVLVEKGHLRIERDGARYVYFARNGSTSARRSALQQLIHTFFGGSTTETMLALLDESSSEMDSAKEQKLRALIAESKKRR